MTIARILRDAGFLGVGNHRRTNNINDTTINDTMKIIDTSDAIQTIIQTRDFCGNESEALRDWEAENGSLSEHQKAQVWQGVKEEWKLCQLKANVQNALTDAQRLQAFRDIETV